MRRPGTRRIYSNPGFDALGALVEEREGRPFEAVLGEWVLAPLGMDDTRLEERPSQGLHGPVGDLAALAAELLQPTLVGPATARAATTVAFPGLVGVVPGVGRFDPCDWGLGLELHDGKAPHWMGERNSPATFGHFGGAGTFLWIDPVARARARRADRPRVRSLGPRGVAAVLRRGARRRRRAALACRRWRSVRASDVSGQGLVNSYLVETGGEVTIVDAGAPSYWGDLPRELAAMGRSLDDVRAVLLTHGHSDHIGFAERIRRERATPILVHELDAALARGEVPNPAKGLGPVKVAPLLQFLRSSRRPTGCCASRGSAKSRRTATAPRSTCRVRRGSSWCPVTRPGSAALHFPGRDALFIGDAIATHSVTTGVDGPRIAPFTADPVQALASLARLDGLEARFVLPGHGQAWTKGVATALAEARSAAAQA